MKIMRKIQTIILGGAAAAFMLTACDSVSEEDRFLPAEIVPQRAVLLEEFTAQDCRNCPDGHAAIREITASLGDSVVAVGIHGGDLADKRRVIGLWTAAGEEYYKAAGSPAQPTATVDMVTSPLQVANWGAEINKLIMVPTPFTVIAKADLSADGSNYDITVDFSSGDDYDGKLMVWICENDIVRWQNVYGTNDNNYVHNHVFRAAVTQDIWGDPVSLKAHQPQQKTYSYPINPSDYWDTAHLYVVAFLYNNDGVAQVTQSKH